MAGYSPPFTISERMLAVVADIGEKLGRINSVRGFDKRPVLRRNNRIRSIHSSLAIEANSLTMDEVRDVLGGKLVSGPRQEIQEVKNAYQAYEEIGSFDPYSLAELMRLHGVMTQHTLRESGVFRSGNEGVFRGGQCIFMAPPPHMVGGLMAELFDWMGRATVHPLILSSVFHYEFVFIHPFADGNGRMARLWQTALLAQWAPVFKYLPLESRIHEFQEEYYQAIEVCHGAGNSDAFIEFMLERIDMALERALSQLTEAGIPVCVRRLMDVMDYDVPYTAAQLLSALGLRSREALRKNYLGPALAEGLIEMSLPDRPTSRNQTYIRK